MYLKKDFNNLENLKGHYLLNQLPNKVPKKSATGHML